MLDVSDAPLEAVALVTGGRRRAELARQPVGLLVKRGELLVTGAERRAQA
ncbi:MAG: hypothetical protein M3296_02670 [Actinomycetota bacterium]|nr:hypothetical protein [Actinomycetota bacterium]